MSDGPLAGKTALITGASTGIGRASAAILHAHGAAIRAVALPGPQLQTLPGELGRERIETLEGDLADQRFLGEVCLGANASDIFVHSAGLATLAPFLESEAADWDRMFAINLRAGLSIAQAAARGMARRRAGKIILISSTMAEWVNTNALAYAASKHALSAARKGLRNELNPLGIQVTELRPGLVGDTEINKGARHPAVVRDLQTRPYTPLLARDIAEAVLFVATRPAGVDVPLIEIRPVGQP